MSRIRCAALLVATGGAYRYLSGGVPVHAQAPVLRPLEPHENSKQLAVANAAKQLTVGRAVFYVRVAVRGVLLLTGAILPLMWAFVLHSISHRLVSKQTMHDLMLQFFMSSGPCFLKLGQWAATRPDKFSKEFCEVVGQLHHSAPKHGWEESRQRIVDAYGGLDLFEHVDHEPIHSGCIAQVHRARLKGDRRDMVVKVMHPGVEDAIEVDLTLARWGLQALSFIIPQSKWLSLTETYYEFDGLMRSQIDFRTEADNLVRFQENFRHSSSVFFPVPVLECATPTVMVETFEEGVLLREWQESNPSKALQQEVGLIGCRAFLKMVFEDNFFHADLHPGNILVRKTDSGGHQLVMLDTGLVSSLSKADRKNFIHLFAAVCVGDGALAGDLMLAGAKTHECTQPERFRRDMKHIVDAVNADMQKSFQLKDIKIGRVLTDTMDAVRVNKVKIDPNFTTLIVAIVVLEGVGRSLWPELNIFRVAAPYVIPHVETSDVRQLAPLIHKLYC
eukprot:TRINITY_DN8150_c0_g1_i5.p1 TRINITY_DN8150_c0_g1~~TRINITY_DN8150_c0_g1_i5.p1  ORF type:complete len:503 (+),score=161.85 TRINITY_DN8150_c0_g1_i5:740-2248(+)